MVKTVFVVDDNFLNRLVLIKQIEMIHPEIKIFEFENGELALEHIRNEGSPDLVFLDLMMPIMDGFEFMDEFERVYYNNKTNVIVVSCLTDMKSKTRAISHNFVKSYINKPTNIEVISSCFEL